MTFREAIKMLGDAQIESPRSEMAYMLFEICGIDASRLPLMYDEQIERNDLLDAIKRRCDATPLQYILGKCEFFGLEFSVTPDCLCPRPDTEISVETALSLLPENAEFLELCTGSGCISVSLCKTRGDISGIATDKFEKTLGVAKKNAEAHGVTDRLTLVCADLFDEPEYIDGKGFNAIVSNPPYIPTRDIENLSADVKKEPIAALDGGEDGLDFYRHIVSEYAKYLKEDGMFIFEIGYDQGDSLCKIAHANGFSCEIVKDLEKNDRVAVLRRI